MSAVGQNIPHDSAVAHVTGESPFIDDLPPTFGEVLVDFVGSTTAHGRILGIDIAAARAVPGIVGVLTARDVPGHNEYGPIVRDDRVLADQTVRFHGEPVVLLIGESRSALAAAKHLVRIDVEPLPPILSIDAARAAESFLGPPRVIQCGDVDAALAAAEHVLDGVLTIGGQEHFYFEPQSALAYPEERGGLVIHSSTQHTSEVQAVVAEVCGLPFHRVTCICRRMGGGFGGKETQAAPIAAMAALAAQLTKRPARAVLGRDDDMAITGKRHPFRSWYKVGFTSEGNITALTVDHFSDGGCSTDLSPSVLERAMLHTDNGYFLPHARITGRVCRTNFPSNTAFRGFGGPQGVAVIENIIEEIAHAVGRDPADVRRLNCYGGAGRDTTPYGQIVRNNVLPALIDRLRHTSDYDRRRTAIDAANAHDPDVLRGLALTTVKFGISFTKRTLNQANALVNIYLDGTVLVATGATEMGQGVNTRLRQLVADELGIPYDWVHVAPTDTDKNNNTSPTAASCGTDLNGAAAIDACSRLRQRLAEFAATLFADPAAGFPASAEGVEFVDGHVRDRRIPSRCIGWRELVPKAYFERVNLGERGFYATPGVDFNRDTGRGNPFLYYTNGAAVAEVQIDRLTGELQVVRADLLMDAGVPINPGIDCGQIVGGFVQGMGWVTTEELKYDAEGRLLSHSPTTYKIPNISDLPPVFNVDLFPNPDNSVSLKRSKAVGEPPLLLGLSVWAAVKNALSYVAGDATVPLNLPATGEEILRRLTEAERMRESVSDPGQLVVRES
ncbi:MAG: xanthine dehydrogenase molybdopterin binding subunit [Planctomycetaceae bacterium]|nr:xanthine dehydrogenase molybdopterin binding subunit [Planctomycetaceae bacterium]